MANIKVQVRKFWQTRPYEGEECVLAYSEDVPPETIENRMAKKTLRREDAVAELAAAAYISLEGAAARAMERSLARPDPRAPKAEAESMLRGGQLVAHASSSPEKAVASQNATCPKCHAAYELRVGHRCAPRPPLARPPVRRT